MRVFSNTATSLDGRIGTVLHDHVAIGSPEDRRMMSVLRAQADAVLVGGRTFRNWPLPLVPDAGVVPPADWSHARPLTVVLTRTGVLDADAHRWPSPRADLLVLGGPGVDAAAHAARFGAEVETTDAPTIGWALDRLAARGCRSVLIEAGGDLIFQALEQNRLSEVFLTLCPWVIGGVGAPSLADGRGFRADSMRRFCLVSFRREQDELFLHYVLDESTSVRLGGPSNGA
jgi:riboflavin biosynthesis pyrimidine reductase